LIRFHFARTSPPSTQLIAKLTDKTLESIQSSNGRRTEEVAHNTEVHRRRETTTKLHLVEFYFNFYGLHPSSQSIAKLSDKSVKNYTVEATEEDGRTSALDGTDHKRPLNEQPRNFGNHRGFTEAQD
jgi:hypothetical protein